MRVLVLGGRGSVGKVIVEELRTIGHEVTPAGRSAAPGWAQVDVTTSHGMAALRNLAHEHRVVVNATGAEDPGIAAAVAGAILVDISATAEYLDELRRNAPVGTGIVLGAGLVPGLSTIMLTALGGHPGDDLDLAVVLGGGESHGTAAVAWTANLAGRPLYGPPEGQRIMNFRESRRLPGAFGLRRHVRADFPDHLLVGAPRGQSVRTYLATDSRGSTAGLAVVGRFPRLRGLVQHAPHLGGNGWSLTALHRESGRTITARGRGQSRTTGVITAHMAHAAGRLRVDRPVTAADVLTLDEVQRIAGNHIEKRGFQ
ncbi:hypothetical protein DY023_17750 [Microbacterium bovistercoris]|uniref:Saccharopine dehydrogenase n=1 Tax=Microbacterium bovistercoris TaxID=2293570 RepID=A0A371NR06_9MICO|nr:hypothetical protein [Microbacterium bovistercoris]REJ04139.1 hypothetical protein DY023_17750 [Microbacterium bovistercoris]